MMSRLFLLTALLLASSASAGSPSLIVARGGWAALDRGASCEALARSVRVAPKGKVQALAAFTFTPDRQRWGEFHVTLRRLPRPGSSVMLTVGDRPFLLIGRGNNGWSSGPLQERAIIAALRDGASMRVEARDASGGRFVDSFPVDGAGTAIDAAAARCAGKRR
jgi:hypothetical protein